MAWIPLQFTSSVNGNWPWMTADRSGRICLTASVSYVKFTVSLNAVTGKSSASGEFRELPAGERQHRRRVNWPLSSCPKGACRKAPGVGTDGLARRYREMSACSYCCVKQSGTAQKAFCPASLAEEPGMQGFLFNRKQCFLLNKKFSARRRTPRKGRWLLTQPRSGASVR